MKTVAKIIAAYGGLERFRQPGKYIRIENPPYMRLVVEYIGQGPRGLPAISVAHYYEQNGDAMRDPEMVFEVNPDEDGLASWSDQSRRRADRHLPSCVPRLGRHRPDRRLAIRQ